MSDLLKKFRVYSQKMDVKQTFPSVRVDEYGKYHFMPYSQYNKSGVKITDFDLWYDMYERSLKDASNS